MNCPIGKRYTWRLTLQWEQFRILSDTHLTWKELEELLIGEYADEGSVIEAVRRN